jgi:hypothetical protein
LDRVVERLADRGSDEHLGARFWPAPRIRRHGRKLSRQTLRKLRLRACVPLKYPAEEQGLLLSGP